MSFLINILNQYCLKPKHVLHVGAHHGEEHEDYLKIGAKPIYVEANPEVFEVLKEKLSNQNCFLHNVAISDKNDKSLFYITSKDQSSSLLKLKKHKEIYPKIRETKTITVDCITIDNLIKKYNYDIDLLHMDIQGAELLALKGATYLLSSNKLCGIYTEVNLAELYEGCVLIGELDDFLNSFGFKRIHTQCNKFWGDAFYINTNYNNVKKRIQIDFDEKYARFGNQLFRYATAKAYAQKHNYILEVPKNWIGREIFENVKDPIVENEYLKCNLEDIPNGESYIKLEGHFEHQKSVDLYSKQDVLWWFKLKEQYDYPKIKDYYTTSHLRRGDFFNIKNRRCIVAKVCFKKAIIDNGYDINKIIWIGEDIKQPFYEEFNIPKEFYFLYDFVLLKNADVIFRSDSTFSWWSAALSNAKIFSPIIGSKIGWNHDIKFIEGNHPTLFYYSRDPSKTTDLYLKDNG